MGPWASAEALATQQTLSQKAEMVISAHSYGRLTVRKSLLPLSCSCADLDQVSNITFVLQMKKIRAHRLMDYGHVWEEQILSHSFRKSPRPYRAA